MSDRPRIRRMDPERDAPIRSWSNMFRSPATASAPMPNGNGAAMGVASDDSIIPGMAMGQGSVSSASTPDPVSEEARRGVESAYRVIDEHLQEGRRAAQARIHHARATASGAATMAAVDPAGIKIATESLQEMIAQGVRFYASLAPLWTSFVNSVAASAGVLNPSPASAPAAASMAPVPILRNEPTTGGAPMSIEIASARMTRVTIDLAPHATAANLATTGLHAIEPERPALSDVTFTIDAPANRSIVRIRVPDNQPAGVYNGVIVDKDSGEARGNLTVHIEA
ncbi:MAG: hypothetical protein QOK03_857 [Candidatus Binataceae bacterium]|nr:hypothetical protein [Candidatus Binataceae bacterium]